MQASDSLEVKEYAQAWIDGASSGNPGPSGAGVLIKMGPKTLGQFSQYLGKTTNNVAEYRSLLLALEESRKLGITRLVVHTDSELIYKQLTGQYKVKNPGIKELYWQVRKLLEDFADFRIRYVPREENREADRLARFARKGK